MLSPQYLQGVPDPIVNVFSAAERKIIAELAKRIVEEDYSKNISTFQFDKVTKIATFQEENKVVLQKASKTSQKKILRIMGKAGKKSIIYDDAIYIAVGLVPVAYYKSLGIKSILERGTKQTVGVLNNFCNNTVKASNLAYNAILDRTYTQIQSGMVDPNNAIIQAVHDVATTDLSKLSTYRGDTTSLESAVRRAVITGINKTVSEAQLERASEMRCQLVQTSAHIGARPTHQPWQGKVFCIEGVHERYGNFYVETGYGTGEGLCGWNCRHSFYPYFEGYSDRFHPEQIDAQENEEEYRLEQKQRYFERQVRAAKKECETIDAAINAAQNRALQDGLYREFQKSSLKLKNREEALERFLKENNLSKSGNRDTVGGWSNRMDKKTEAAVVDTEKE